MKTIEEIVNDEGLYSLDDLKVLFNHYRLSWNDDYGNSYSILTEGVDIPMDSLISGSEIIGTFSGWEFESDDSNIKFESAEGIRGIVKALAYVTTDRKFVIFY